MRVVYYDFRGPNSIKRKFKLFLPHCKCMMPLSGGEEEETGYDITFADKTNG